MAFTELIAANAAAVTSDALALTGPTTIVADDLTNVKGIKETVTIHREKMDSTYTPLIIDSAPVVLTELNPVITIELYGNIKAVKGATTNAVAVGYGA